MYLPGTLHELDLDVTYETVDRGQATRFLDYSAAEGKLMILPGATIEADVGPYKIKLRLVDSEGALGEFLTLTINLVTDKTVPAASDRNVE